NRYEMRWTSHAWCSTGRVTAVVRCCGDGRSAATDVGGGRWGCGVKRRGGITPERAGPAVLRRCCEPAGRACAACTRRFTAIWAMRPRLIDFIRRQGFRGPVAEDVASDVF